MINLLPPDQKQSILYSRRNRLLTRWIAIIFASIAGVILVSIFGLFYLTKAIDESQKQVTTSKDQLKAQKLTEVQASIENISDGLKLTTQVLGKEILFSKLIQQVGAAMPSNAVLTSLTLSELTGGIDLQAYAKDYNSATQVQINLSDPKNKIFSKADILNVGCGVAASGTASTGPSGYPCNISIRAEFGDTNPFLFISKVPAS